MKKILFLFLMLGSLFGSLLALDTGQMNDAKFINTSVFDTTQANINEVAVNSVVSVLHKDSLMFGGYSGLSGKLIATSVINMQSYDVVKRKGFSAEYVGGV